MTKTLRELIVKAEEDIDTYKYPDVSETQSRLSQILEAAGLGGIEHNELTYLGFRDGRLHIDTTYSSRGCTDSESFDIPEKIIDAEDPVREARIWGAEKRLKKAEVDLARAKRDVTYAETKLKEAHTALHSALSA